MKADNEQETAEIGLRSFINVSRSSVEVLKLTKSFKALECLSFILPFAADNNVWSSNVNELFNSPEFLSETDHTENQFSISDNLVTQIPKSLFDESFIEKSFEFVFGNSDELHLKQYEFRNSPTVGFYAIPKGFPGSIIANCHSSYLLWLDDLSTKSKRSEAFLTLNERQFSLVVYRNGQLNFCNWFQFEKPEDVLYFLMASLEALNVLHSEIDLVLQGDIEKGDETYLLLSRFISNISFAKRPKNLSYSYSFNQLAEHRLPFLFAAACA
ncbi:MAG: hypothetical protein RL266_1385 [Bacteroidota bacterium]